MPRGRALVVDDSAPVRAAVAETLRQSGDLEEVLEAEDGLAALRIMAEAKPDIVICDLVMPGCDGIQLLRLRSAKPELTGIPVLILTADTELDRKVELFDRGATDYVCKPFDPRELVARVRVHLRLKLMAEDLAAANEKLVRLSCTDPLTDLFNRRHFNNVIDVEVARLVRYGIPLALILADIDHFKRVNDEHGHQVGDEVLRSVATTLMRSVRKADVVARYGGEEIAIVLTNTGTAGAFVLAERLRAAVERSEVRSGDRAVRCTASFGVAAADGPGDVASAASLVGRADAALYAAKHAGRNRVVMWSAELEEQD
ncbi:MAG: diguanylate cyclase [Polyangiaceae bacterium]|nr:diguanylate cyclase [Polyangiaceae bacterium]